jgi:hypothetical protein
VLLGAVLGAAVLTGCQSNPKPPPLDDAAASSPPPTASPTSAAPTLPAEAKGTSEAAAEAFVRHFFDSLKYAINSGDTEHLRDLAANSCQSCVAISENIEKTYGAGGSISSKGWLLQSASLTPRQPRDRPILDLGVLMTPERVVERAGADPKTFGGGKQPMTMYLVRKSGEWRVTRLDRVT